SNTLPLWCSYIIKNNTDQEGNPICYYKNTNDFVVPSEASQIILANCSNFMIQNLSINNMIKGIEIAFSHHGQIHKNRFTHNQNSINVIHSSDITIYNNTLINNSEESIGITLENDCNIDIHKNTISHTINGIIGGYISNSTIYHNNITTNHPNGIVIGLEVTYNVSVYENILSKGTYGLYVTGYNNSIYQNNVTNNYLGIALMGSNNTVFRNQVADNQEYGLYLTSFSNNSVYENNIVNNTIGIYLYSGWYQGTSSYNYFYHNNFDNIENVYEEGDSINFWNKSYPYCGNYWSDYDEPEEGAYDEYTGCYQNIPGSDGIADTPYNISEDGETQDKYPLMHPYPNSFFIRGDCNGDRTINPADYTYLQDYLYNNGPQPVGIDMQPNMNSGDLNDDNQVTSDDLTYLDDFLSGGTPPLPPYPLPGVDPTP
ncbi:MAG: hypothetical protein DRN08_04720, partial [Thermoplasmata archaeon]